MRRQTLRGKQLQKGIVDEAHRLGWSVAHFPPAPTPGGYRTAVAADGKGFLDLLLLRERVVAAEIKGDGDTLRPEQREWIDRWLNAGIECYVWRPKEWLDGTVTEILKHRGRP